MICTRFGPIVVVVLGLAIIPTLVHSYVGVTIDDGRQASKVARSLAGLDSKPTFRAPDRIKKSFEAHDWIERRYAGPGTSGVVLFIARSYDAKRLYHHPERGLFSKIDVEDLGATRLPQMKDVPVHVLRSRRGQGQNLVAYSLFYDGSFVDNPYVLQLNMAWQLLFSGRRPMTVFLVYDSAFPRGASVEDALATRVLCEAIRSYLSQPAGVSQAPG